jgi:hypothetical protein
VPFKGQCLFEFSSSFPDVNEVHIFSSIIFYLLLVLFSLMSAKVNPSDEPRMFPSISTFHHNSLGNQIRRLKWDGN